MKTELLEETRNFLKTKIIKRVDLNILTCFDRLSKNGFPQESCLKSFGIFERVSK